MLLFLANLEKERLAQPVIPKIIGTTGSGVNLFMNKVR
jgi:hypothetical protein